MLGLSKLLGKLKVSSNKPRIQSYIESMLYEQFEQERLAWGLSQSQALERMLSERYQSNVTRLESEHELTPLINSINELRSRVSTLEDELESKLLSKLEDKFSKTEVIGKAARKSPVGKESLKERWKREVEDKYAWSDGYCRLRLQNGNIFVGLICSVARDKTCKIFDSLTDTQLNVGIDRLILPSELELVTSELPSESELVTSELPSELISRLCSELESELNSELPNEVELSKGLTQRALSRRLGCSHPYIKSLAVSGELEDWSQNQDPQGLSWELRGKKYYPKSLQLQESVV